MSRWLYERNRGGVATMRRRRALLVLSVVLTAGGMISVGAPSAAGLQQVGFLSWPSYGKNGGFYLAADRGYFHDRGLDFVPVNTYLSALGEFTAGKAEIGQIQTSDALRAIEQGAPLRIIAVRDAVLPVVTVAFPRSGIRTPKDYAGKRWGLDASNRFEQDLMPILAERVGFNYASVKLIHADYPAQLQALIEGKVDFFAAGWGSNLPQILLTERQLGIELSVIRWSRYGIDVYGDCLVARDDWLGRHPGLAKAFLTASVRGFKDEMRDPTAAVAAVMKFNTDLASYREVIRLEVTQSLDLLYDTYSRTHGLFSISREKLLRTRNAALGGAAKAPIDRAYSNAYTPGP